MSYDIFVIDLPPDITDVDQIPANFKAGPLGPRGPIINAIRRVVPEAMFDEAGWASLDGGDHSIEINLGLDDPVESFAFHLRGGEKALFVAAAILDELGLRAVAPGTESGLFTLGAATHAYAVWRAYRDRAAGSGNNK